MNGKRVLRLMREDNLLCLRQRKWVRTTDSSHRLPVYPNLVPKLVLTGMNQLWVADITYIRLRWEFIYLALILDVFSRRSVGWQLGRRLDTELALAALQMALARRQVQPDWCIILTAGCSMLPTPTPSGCNSMGFASA